MSTSRTDRSSPPAAGPSIFSGRAPKGKACLNCRRRKMKCDCTRPVCGQCIRFNRERDCEYTDGDQRSRTEILEENIAILQARVRELENPEESPSSMTLVEVPSRSDGSIFETQGDAHSRDPSPVLSRPNSGLAITSDASLSYQVAQGLIEAFLSYAPDLGFFLNVPRFLNRVTHMFSSSPHQIPSDALLSTIYLWGIRISGDDHLSTHETAYLARALHHIATSLSLSSPNIMHLLQAEVLLSNYFFNSGRFLEGRSHLGSAVSLILTYRLNKIRSTLDLGLGTMHLVNMHTPLPGAADMVEEGERIQAFWSVYILDKTWAVALGRGALLVEDGSPASRIETPWPLTMEQYQEDQVPTDYAGNRTIQRFLNDTLPPSSLIISPLAFRAQAAALLDRAVWLSSTCLSDPTTKMLHQPSFTAHDALIERFILSLPPLDSLQSYPRPVIRSIVITHMLARVAVMQLHMGFSDEEVTSAVKILSASKSVVAALKILLPGQPEFNLQGSVYTDPLLPVLLTAAAQVMIIELTKSKINRAIWQTGSSCMNSTYLMVVLNEFISAIAGANRGSVLTGLQIAKLEQARAVGGV